MTNTLYYGDNLDILREHIPDASVDLIYLDPPFNSNRSYNVLFREANGTAADSQITAFDDSWHWGQSAEQTLREIETGAAPHIVEMMQAIVRFVGRNDVTAYLVMMTVRLIELHRVLKPTGSLYLHCDPTASHYLKVVMDTIFGKGNFRNEISWRRSNPKSLHKTNFANCRDVILRFSKSSEAVFNKIFAEHDLEYVNKAYRYTDQDGRRYRLLPLLNPNDDRPNLTYEFLGITRVWRWTRERMERAYAEGRVVQLKPGAVPQYKLHLDESKGRTITDDWNDVPQVAGKEVLGYPTQKPLALLERIISASSNPGDLVLDPFCGCGTTVCAAQKLGRRWIGIDVTHLAIALMRQRLRDMFGDALQYEVVGQPADLASAEALARHDRHQFEWWALSLIQARPAQDRKKGADQGVDGVLFFIDEAKKAAKKVVVQVKSGHVQSSYIRDLRAVTEREKAALGFLITLERPTQPMLTEALAAGYYHSPGWNRDYQRIQVRTIEQLLNGEWFEFPQANVTLAQAERVKAEADQGELF
jgi:site-specific DNA-methyltransferase (adenine-specific)